MQAREGAHFASLARGPASGRGAPWHLSQQSVVRQNSPHLKRNHLFSNNLRLRKALQQEGQTDIAAIGIVIMIAIGRFGEFGVSRLHGKVVADHRSVMHAGTATGRGGAD